MGQNGDKDQSTNTSRKLVHSGMSEKKETIYMHQIKSHMIWDCRTKENTMCSKKMVTIKWIPGHIEVQSNEKPDILAKLDSA